MSKHKGKKPIVETEVKETIEQVVETEAKEIIEPVVETEVEEIVESVNDEIEEIVTPEPPAEPVYGKVTECAKLNVRKEPNTNAEVITTLSLGAEVLIDEVNSTKDFYKVVTSAGVDGFCMKKYISVNQ